MLCSLLLWTLLAASAIAQDVSIQPVPSVTAPSEPSPEPTPPPSEPTPEPPVVPPSTEPTSQPPDTPSITTFSEPPPTTTPTDSVSDESTANSAVSTGSASASVSDVISDSSSGVVSSIASASGDSSSALGSSSSGPAGSATTAAVTASTINPEATALSTVTASNTPSGSVSPPAFAPPQSSSDSPSGPGLSSSLSVSASARIDGTASGAAIPTSASGSVAPTQASGSATPTNTAAGTAATGSAPVESRTPIINVEATDTVAGTSTINSASTSIPTTPVIAATARSYPLDQGDDNFVVAQDEINLPERFLSDEIVTTLTYTANYDKNLCETKAQQYSTRASQSLLSHWSFLLHRRQNTESTSLCLPALYEIPTTVHWVIPSGANRDQWVNWDAWNFQITQTRNQLQQLNVALNLSPFRFYQGTDSDRMTNRPKAPENLEFAKGWVSAAKEASGSTAYNHLNIFIVENPNDDSLGYSNYPGATAQSYYPDAVIIGAASLPGNTRLFDQANVGDQDGREGTTLAHEIGHWLGLLHLHEGGCAGTDGIATTPQYASGSDYSKTCLGEDKGPDGIYEHNLMSEQMVRAAVGYFLRRNGLSSSTIESQWLKLCPDSARNVTRRSLPLYDVSSHLPLSRRQMSNELSRYCQQSDLTVPDYEYSSLASAGLFNPNSPTIPLSPGIVRPETINIGNAESGASDRAGSNFGDLDNRVNAQIAQTGSITTNDTTPIDSPEPPARSSAKHVISKIGASKWVLTLLALVASGVLL